MIIVLEGPDAAGKSTLAKALSDILAIGIRHSGGPGKRPGEIHERIDAMATDSGPTIYDRHPCVSQNIYLDALRLPGEYVDDVRLKRFYDAKPLIIYCRPPPDALTRHEMSEHANADYHRHVERNYEELTRRYDKWALRHATMIYRIGDDIGELATQLRARMTDTSFELLQALRDMRRFEPMRDVEEFHNKFRIAYNGKPRLLPDDLGNFRMEFMDEELGEYKTTTYSARDELQLTLFEVPKITTGLEQMLDALVDLTYVALGTAHLHGFDFRAAWQRVHEANMKKVLAATAAQSKRGYAGDVIKPPGWQPPSHLDLVVDHAHQHLAQAVRHAG